MDLMNQKKQHRKPNGVGEREYGQIPQGLGSCGAQVIFERDQTGHGSDDGA